MANPEGKMFSPKAVFTFLSDLYLFNFSFFFCRIACLKFLFWHCGYCSTTASGETDAENRRLGNTWKIVLLKANFFLAENVLPSRCFNIFSICRALTPWAGTFFVTHSYWEASNPENSQRMMFFPLNPSSLPEIQLLHSSLSPWLNEWRLREYVQTRHEVSCIFLTFSFFKTETPNLMSPDRRKWNRATYIGREEKELLRDDCPTLHIGDEMPAVSFFCLNLLISEIPRNSSSPSQ